MNDAERSTNSNPFILSGRVGRGAYATTGVLLMLLKYGVEAAAILGATGRVYTPLDFAAPWLATRAEFADDGGAWLAVAWLVWTIPFVWIAVAMTLRRARDADYSPWLCLLILLPLLNFATMLFMAIAPTSAEATAKARIRRRAAEANDQAVREAWASPQSEDEAPTRVPPADDAPGLVAALGGLAVGVVYCVAMVLLSVYGFDSYGAALFFGAPVVTGAASGYLYNRGAERSIAATLGHASAVVACCCGAFLIVGLEGGICIIMAMPILGPLALFGALIGRAIAGAAELQRAERDDRGMLGCLIVLPVLAGVEPMIFEPLPLMAETTIEINAPRDEVWRAVVAFPEIESRPAWYFRWGIASPIRARIDGHGVGAVRYCEFTTGAFVEPITVWDEPTRLAFDVTDQPDPMFEMTPYRHLHPPHLQKSFLSDRGEFELIELPGGGTRLVGRTWYTLDIAPHGYWRHWSDALVHRIHLRVLEHIKVVAERNAA
ncbi:MAG: DUF805 domain-containing protein [Planctomycetota bacterium]